VGSNPTPAACRAKKSAEQAFQCKSESVTGFVGSPLETAGDRWRPLDPCYRCVSRGPRPCDKLTARQPKERGASRARAAVAITAGE
jgi:hypothetical protein